jgi:hypothetical protein
MARKDEARRWEVKMTISDQELFCDFYLWERIFVDSQINHKFVNPQICERGEIWECSITYVSRKYVNVNPQICERGEIWECSK